MTRRSDPLEGFRKTADAHPLSQAEADALSDVVLEALKPEYPSARRLDPMRKPGMVQRLTIWGLTHLSLLMGVSLVGWLLFLALLALLVLPGCNDPGTVQRENRAFDSTSRLIVAEANELAAGRIDLATFVAATRQALAELQAAEQGERSNASTSWLEILGTSLGASGVVGAGIHLLRNSTRKADLADLNERIDSAHERIELFQEKGGPT